MKISFRERVFSGAIWMSFISFLQQILQFVVQIVLARLLVPQDYGTVAIVMSVCTFAVVFLSAGIGTALVQRKVLSSKVIDAATVCTGGIAIIFGGVVFCGSEWAADSRPPCKSRSSRSLPPPSQHSPPTPWTW